MSCLKQNNTGWGLYYLSAEQGDYTNHSMPGEIRKGNKLAIGRLQLLSQPRHHTVTQSREDFYSDAASSCEEKLAVSSQESSKSQLGPK